MGMEGSHLNSWSGFGELPGSRPIVAHRFLELQDCSAIFLGSFENRMNFSTFLALLTDEGVSELRIDYGPGYRVYFIRREREAIILLAGGDKRTQTTDIKIALQLARNL